MKEADFIARKYAKVLEEFTVRLNEIRLAAIDTVDLIDEVFEILGVEEDIDD